MNFQFRAFLINASKDFNCFIKIYLKFNSTKTKKFALDSKKNLKIKNIKIFFFNLK